MNKMIELVKSIVVPLGLSFNDVVRSHCEKDKKGNTLKDSNGKAIIKGYFIGTKYSWLFDIETLKSVTPSMYYWTEDDDIDEKYRLEFLELVESGEIPKDTEMKATLFFQKSIFEPSEESILKY